MSKIGEWSVLPAVPPGGYVVITEPSGDPTKSVFAKVPASALGGTTPPPGGSTWDNGASAWDGGTSVWDGAGVSWLSGFATWLGSLPKEPPAETNQPWNDNGKLAFSGVNS